MGSQDWFLLWITLVDPSGPGLFPGDQWELLMRGWETETAALSISVLCVSIIEHADGPSWKYESSDMSLSHPFLTVHPLFYL